MKRWYTKLGMGAMATAAAVVLLDALYLEQYYFEVREYVIGKKESDKKVRILLLTDLHFVRRFWPFHRKLARKINALNPDLVLISGDIIDQWGEAGPARRFFNLLNPVIPKFAIPGNHDNKNEVSRGTLRKILQNSNGHLLANNTRKVVVHNTEFTITGVDDFIEGKPDFGEAVKDTGKEEHHLLLVHSPLQHEEVIREMKRLNLQRPPERRLDIRYIFAGHNHGGQVRFGPLVPKLPELAGPYINGWYNEEKPFLYVSKGFGTSYLRLRFGSRSEITLFHYGV